MKQTAASSANPPWFCNQTRYVSQPNAQSTVFPFCKASPKAVLKPGPFMSKLSMWILGGGGFSDVSQRRWLNQSIFCYFVGWFARRQIRIQAKRSHDHWEVVARYQKISCKQLQTPNIDLLCCPVGEVLKRGSTITMGMKLLRIEN